MSAHELIGRQLGGYNLEEEIGRGSSGVVYRGKQISLDREVAVKVLLGSLGQDPSSVARFIREAQIIAGLNHQNIVQIYDAGKQRDQLYFVMEYVTGLTVRSLLRLDGSIPQHLAAEYIAQAADALDIAYQEGHVIHRDIKPENVMLDFRGKIKILDFGLAHVCGLQQITQARRIWNNVNYASPEQIAGAPLDHRSDIYALGVVLYEMVTGQHPYVSREPQELIQAINKGLAPPPTALNPSLSPALERIIFTAMEPDRDRRYAQASSMAEDLRSLQIRAPAEERVSVQHQQIPAAGDVVENKRNQQHDMPGKQIQRPYTPVIAGILTLPARKPRELVQQ